MKMELIQPFINAADAVLAETLHQGGVQVTGQAVRDRTVRDQHAKDPAGWTDVAAMDPHRLGDAQVHVGGAVDAQHVGPQVGKQQRAHRAGANAGQLDDPYASERACHGNRP